MNRRALLLSAMAAALVPADAVDARAVVRIRVDMAPLVAPIRELTELIPLAADCDVGTRARLVQLFETGRNFVEVVHLDRLSALGARERLVLYQPSDRLLLCVAALRALRGNGDVVHQAHDNSSRVRLATTMVDGPAPGVESGRGYSLLGTGGRHSITGQSADHTHSSDPPAMEG